MVKCRGVWCRGYDVEGMEKGYGVENMVWRVWCRGYGVEGIV